eukprot:4366801-Pyramimonas_sp.AAC.1
MHGTHDLQRLSPKRPYAGLVLQGRSLGGQRLLGCEKVRAHLALDCPDINEAERLRRVGNDAADRAAKLGVAMHPLPSDDLSSAVG